MSAAAPGRTQRTTWDDARHLIWRDRGRLLVGLSLMLLNRLSGLVLPASAKYLLDDVVGRNRPELLMPLVLAGLAATAVQVVTSFLLGQVLGIAGQRAIAAL